MESSVVFGSFQVVAVKSVLVANLSVQLDATSTVESASPSIFDSFAVRTSSVIEESLSSISGCASNKPEVKREVSACPTREGYGPKSGSFLYFASCVSGASGELGSEKPFVGSDAVDGMPGMTPMITGC